VPVGCCGWGCLQTGDAGAVGGGCSRAPTSPTFFQSAGPSRSGKPLSPTAKGIVRGAPSAGEKWQGERV